MGEVSSVCSSSVLFCDVIALAILHYVAVMGGHLKSSSGWGEFGLVVGGAFGTSIICSLYYVSDPASRPAYTSGGQWCLVVYELIFLILLGSLLRHRGWTAGSFGLKTRWSDVPIGLAMALVAYGFYWGGLQILAFATPTLAKSISGLTVVQQGLSIWSTLAVVALNPFYEEIFVLGYIVTVLSDGKSASMAINVSVAVRLLYHLYQGVNAVVLIVPLGLIFAYWFAHARRLWPVIVAHAALDLAAFLPYVKF